METNLIVVMQHLTVKLLVSEPPKVVCLLQLLAQKMDEGMVVVLVEPLPQLRSIQVSELETA